MSAAISGPAQDRVGRFARAALKRALGVVTGDRRLEAEGAAERETVLAAGNAARPQRRGGRNPAEGRDAR